jgi:2-amino-4-hydroxy-6-hydroxymethyldihydropteridine diphosphokinase
VTSRLYLGLGGNVGDDAAILARFGAVAAALAALGPVRRSPVYRSAPIGPAQAPFLNAALALHVADVAPLPAELLALILETERLLGRDRRREARWGPRTIDLDVLWWPGRDGWWQLDDGGLEVPHPRLTERRFALAPLADLLGDDVVIAGRPLGAWLHAVRDQDVALTAFAIP